MNVITRVCSLLTKRKFDSLDAILVLLIQIAVIVPFIGNDHGGVILERRKFVEYSFWDSTIILAMAFSCNDQVFLFFCIFFEQLVDAVGHCVILNQLSLEDLSVHVVGLLTIVEHFTTTNHGLKHVIVEVRSLKSGNR